MTNKRVNIGYSQKTLRVIQSTVVNLNILYSVISYLSGENVTFLCLFPRLFLILCVMFILTFLANINQTPMQIANNLSKDQNFLRMFFFHLKYSFFSSYLFITWFDISYMNDKTVSYVSFVLVFSLTHTTPTVCIPTSYIKKHIHISLLSSQINRTVRVDFHFLSFQEDWMFHQQK